MGFVQTRNTFFPDSYLTHICFRANTRRIPAFTNFVNSLISASIAATLYNVGYANSIAQSMSRNQASVLVLTPQEYFGILRDRAKNNPVVAASCAVF